VLWWGGAGEAGEAGGAGGARVHFPWARWCHTYEGCYPISLHFIHCP